MKSADAFPSSCGEPALNFCSLAQGLTSTGFDPTTARDNRLFHELSYTANLMFYLFFQGMQAKFGLSVDWLKAKCANFSLWPWGYSGR
jgi:hypothetical protein